MNLSVENVRIAYGRGEVVFGVSLDVPDGSFTCLMGRNGVGKTTLLNGIMGVLPVKTGRVSIDGRDINSMSTPQRAQAGMGYVPQGHPVFPHLTAKENLDVVRDRVGRGDNAAVDEALDVFPALRGLLGRPAGLLSGGQAQQLAMARALVSRPKILILDEPTEGIQPSIIGEIEDAIAALHSSGMTVLLVEQYVEFALRLAQRYALMEGGLITHAGDTESMDTASFADLLAV